MVHSLSTRRLALLVAVIVLGTFPLMGVTRKHSKKKNSTSSHVKSTSAVRTSKSVRKAHPTATQAHKASYTRSTTTTRQRRPRYSAWDTPTYADSTVGDMVDGEDLTIRRAAVDALGTLNGTIVAVDPRSGRVLSVVNQKLALKGNFQPCSTIKLVAALAALEEGLIERNTMLRLYGRTKMNLTEALAHSNNQFFAQLGNKLGYEKVIHYAKWFGLGEPAGLEIEGESPGALAAAPPKEGGVGMMTSFGEGISLTPLQLASLVSSIANGGTMYYLQYPRTQQEALTLVPRVKRRLNIEQRIPDILPGMMAAVEYGTARRIGQDPNEPIFGKTGTCTDNRTHMGWFGSFNSVGNNKLVVVVMLTGGKGVSGPAAAGVAGNVYKALSEKKYFVDLHPYTPAALVSTQTCCSR
jgi:penicillin-binding protein 2